MVYSVKETEDVTCLDLKAYTVCDVTYLSCSVTKICENMDATGENAHLKLLVLRQFIVKLLSSFINMEFSPVTSESCIKSFKRVW